MREEIENLIGDVYQSDLDRCSEKDTDPKRLSIYKGTQESTYSTIHEVDEKSFLGAENSKGEIFSQTEESSLQEITTKSYSRLSPFSSQSFNYKRQSQEASFQSAKSLKVTQTYFTPKKDIILNDAEKITTPYSEVVAASISQETPQTIPKALWESEGEENTKALDLRGCLCSSTSLDICKCTTAYGEFDCELPANFDESYQESHTVGYLIPSIEESCLSSKQNQHKRPILTVVLDLDETLIYNRFGFGKRSVRPHLRPYLIPFLLSVPHHLVEVVIWTASTPQTARDVVTHILKEVQNFLAEMDHEDNSSSAKFLNHSRSRLIDHLIARNSYWYLSPQTEGITPSEYPPTTFQYHTKDLRLLGRDLKKVLMVENSLHCCKLQPKNCVIVKDFCGNIQQFRDATFMESQDIGSKLKEMKSEYQVFSKILRQIEAAEASSTGSTGNLLNELGDSNHDITLIRLAALIRKACRDLHDKDSENSIPQLLQRYSEQRVLIESENSPSMSGTQSFFMNYLGGQTFSLPTVSVSSENRYFGSLNARINASINGPFFQIAQSTLETEGRQTI